MADPVSENDPQRLLTQQLLMDLALRESEESSRRPYKHDREAWRGDDDEQYDNMPRPINIQF